MELSVREFSTCPVISIAFAGTRDGAVNMSSLQSLSLKQRAGILGWMIYAVGFLCLIIFRPGDHELFTNILIVCHVTPHVFTGICCLFYSRRGRHTTPSKRIGWLLIGLACFSNLTGDGILYCYEQFGGGHTPFPSWADIPFL